MIDKIEEVYKEVVGRRREILMIVAALQAGKHIFLEGPPGTSKSTVLKAISDHMGTRCCLVTGNSDLTTSKLIGYFDPAETLSKGYKPEYYTAGPLLDAMQRGSYLYIEEFNRLPDETTNVFVTVMSEKKLNVPRLGIVESDPDFRIIAALNPLDDIGISRISRALKDRFSSIRMDYQSVEEEMEIVKRRTTLDAGGIIELAVAIARDTRRHPDVKLGSSVRGSIDMIDIYAKSMKGLGKSISGYRVDDDLLFHAALMSFRSKIWIYETAEKTPEEVIREIFDKLQKKLSFLPREIDLFSDAATGRSPRDKSEYTRMDHRIESMIEENQLEQLLDFAQDHALRIGDMLGNYRLALAQWEVTDHDLLRKLLTMTWDRLDDETRRTFVHMMIGMVYRVSKNILWQGGTPTGEPVVRHFNFQSDEIDLDQTVESLTESRFLSYENIYVVDRKKHKKTAVIMIDASGSMHGSNLSIAAIAASSLAMNLNFRDKYGVIFFSDKYHIFKRIDQPRHLDEVIRDILDISPEGRTNISIGLSAGLRELRRSNVRQKMGILLTDGWQNIGQDPIKMALRFPQLHVVNLPGGNAELSKEIARSGRGRFVPLDDMLDVSKAIITCLMQ